jgi:hypothetical protein
LALREKWKKALSYRHLAALAAKIRIDKIDLKKASKISRLRDGSFLRV